MASLIVVAFPQARTSGSPEPRLEVLGREEASELFLRHVWNRERYDSCAGHARAVASEKDAKLPGVSTHFGSLAKVACHGPSDLLAGAAGSCWDSCWDKRSEEL